MTSRALFPLRSLRVNRDGTAQTSAFRFELQAGQGNVLEWPQRAQHPVMTLWCTDLLALRNHIPRHSLGIVQWSIDWS